MNITHPNFDKKALRGEEALKVTYFISSLIVEPAVQNAKRLIHVAFILFVTKCFNEFHYLFMIKKIKYFVNLLFLSKKYSGGSPSRQYKP